MGDFAADTAAIFDGPLAVDATYTPIGGSAAPLRVVASRPDAIADVASSRIRTETAVFLVLVASVADPDRGDLITLTETGESFVVQGRPARPRNRLYWRVDTRPA